jgi:predicted Rossmann-fold nucleotide-binding protein
MSKKISLAIFASDQGAGGNERGTIMSQAGSFLAAKGVSFVCLAQDNILCTPLITSARSAGAEIKIIADEEFNIPKKLQDISLERFQTGIDRYKRIDELSDAFIGLPGSLLSAKSLFEVWNISNKNSPIVLFNKNRSFEFMRGFALDVISKKVKKLDRRLQHADSFDDLWNRLNKMI